MTMSTKLSMARFSSNASPFPIYQLYILTRDDSLEQSVREDIDYLRSSSYIDKSIRLHGFVFDLLDTGLLKRISAA